MEKQIGGSSFRAFWSSVFGFILSFAASQDPSLSPPHGNAPFLKVVGKGVQVYRCVEQTAGLKYELLRAEANLYASATNNRRQLLGYHYFLPRLDGGGGKPTWALVATPGDNTSASPSSTATFKVIANVASKDQKNIASLLLRATSHSGDGPLSRASYVQRLNSSGGAPPSCCFQSGELLKAPYESEYVFWSQNNSPSDLLPPSLAVPPGNIPLVSYFAQGFQIYEFNGSSWVIQNVSAALSSVPGDPIVGKHFFLPEKDGEGGQPSWEIFVPGSRVTVKAMAKLDVEAKSIPWLLLQATSHAGQKYFLGGVSYVQRLFTSGGAPPTHITTTIKMGDLYHSEYTAIYFFYVPQ